jgi:hypothetical protein
MSAELVEKATSHQMSFELFEDMVSSSLDITASPKEIGFQRNNVFVDTTDLSVTARRAVDAAYFVVAQEKSIQTQYDVELSYFKWLMRYDSNNYQHLRGLLRDTQKAAIQVTDTPLNAVPSASDRWISVPLLAAVGLCKGRIIFEVHPVLQRHIQDPAKTHWLSLRVTASFTLLYARSIYDHVVLCLLAGATDWTSVDDVREWPGKSLACKAEFKYFRRDYLEPAVRQINELSDIEISYETRTATPGSRKIERIRFRVSKKKDALPAVQVLLGAKELYTTLKNEFGLSEKNFDEIIANRNTWTDEWIDQAIEFTRFNIKRGKVTKSPSGYLMKALRDNLRVSSSEKVIAAQQAQVAETAVAKLTAVAEATKAKSRAKEDAEQNAARKIAQEISLGQNGFALVETPEDRAGILREFALSLPGKTALKRLGLAPEELTEPSLLQNEALYRDFGQFMFNKLKLMVAKH